MQIYDARLFARLTVRKTALAIAVFAAAIPSAFAQTSIFKEQGKLIRAPQDVGTLGSDLFGDKVNFYTGSLEFVQTDVSLPGNNALPVSVGRRLVAGQEATYRTHFGGWDLDVPHLHGIFATLKGWTAALGDPNLRCSSFGKPRGVSPVDGGSTGSWDATEFWHGSFMYIPGGGDQELLARSPSYTQTPTGTPYSYPVVTRNNWSIRCLPSMAANNGTSGQAFLAVAPDGTQYRFDWMVSRPLTQLSKTNFNAEPLKSVAQQPFLNRSEMWILPTLVTDRFGNTVTYTYDSTNKWQLQSIVSNDAGGSPRTITFSYVTPGSTNSNLISSITDGTRTWRYTYENPNLVSATLTSVTLPDNSSWQLGGIVPLLVNVDYHGEGDCSNPGVLIPSILTGSMIHPSGARGDFSLTVTRHGRAGVERECSSAGPESGTENPKYPKIFDMLSLTRKTLSGPGLPTMTWKTSYPADEASSWAPCNGCAAAKLVEVVDPQGDKTEYTFGTLFRSTEGQLQRTDIFDADGGGVSLLRSTTLRYAEPVSPFGSSDQRRGDGELAARIIETDRRQISQQGVDFSWEATTFDPFGRPKIVRRSSSLGPARSETTDYSDQLSLWVLGQVKTVTASPGNAVMVANVYDPAKATLSSVSHFGHLEKSMTYNADGTLATRKDGLNHVTTYANYKRGIAQHVTYADNTTESAEVTNCGVIASTTDANAYKTQYGYDAMCRLAGITQPAGDSVAWNPTTIAFQRVATQEFDLAPGHWRQDITTGIGRTSTYFDALWRPVYTHRSDLTRSATTSRIVKRGYDFGGRVTFQSYPKRDYGSIAEGIYHEYDALGRATVTSTQSEQGVLYDSNSYASGFKKNHTDARGHTTVTSYQLFDEPTDTAISNIVAPEGVNVAIARDLFGKPTSITRSGDGKSATRNYVYDGFGRLCKTIEPETAATLQGYDAANNVIWRANGLALPSPTACDTASPPAKKISFGYDTLNRLTSTTFSDGSPAITRTYTADGLPDTATSNGIVWTNHYNKRRLNERESMAYGGATYVVDRAYDANGALRRLTYPDQTSIDYAPNALGEPSRAGSFASAVTYYPNGAIASFRYGNGVVHAMSQNARGLPEVSTDTGVLNDKYGYDENANVKSNLDQQEGISSRAMVYDDLDRLTQTTSAATFGVIKNGYDALDNLTSVTVSQGPTARSTILDVDAATNRIKTISSATAAYSLGFEYDGQGNVTKRGVQRFVFDQGNRLKSASGKASYAYDGIGHRVSTVGADGVNRVAIYTQDGQLLYMRATSVPLTAGTKYIYLGRHQVAEVKAAGAN